ncbi:DUF7094 domain-containing protein [Halorussus amylolyticus]|uniref:DUF7094 domain-containing protein n=1 Tax=Halorussus amylolyticus TaxID=1126242 RepID=UPI00104E2181|nr:hypothetical protein [Halorussus amylolyticus]
MRFAPVMLALLLALSPGAVAMQASAPTGPAEQNPAVTTDAPVSTNATETDTAALDTARPAISGNTTAVLTLGTEPDRAEFDSPSVSLGDSLEADNGEFRSDLDVKTLDQRLDNAGSNEAEKRILNQYRYQLENRIISLETRERRAASEFSNGSITANQYVRTLGQIDAEADEIRTSIRVLRDRVREVPNFAMPNIERTLGGKLISLEGPVRDRVAKTLQGATDSPRIYVQTAESGVVLTMITDRQYVREAYRPDNRDLGSGSPLSREEAENQVIRPQYPWVLNNSPIASHSAYSSLQMVEYSYEHSHGNLTAYVDTGTEEVYREVQYKSLSGTQSLPPGPGVRNTTTSQFGDENVTLTVNRTYAGGPLRVELANETGEPLDGEVTVDDEYTIQTGDDGVVWTLGPSEQFRVSATYEGATVEVDVAPVALEATTSED